MALARDQSGDRRCEVTVLHVSTTDSFGGAGRAAHRIHRALVEAGCGSSMRVLRHGTDDDSVKGGIPGRRSLLSRAERRAGHLLGARQERGWTTTNAGWHTFAHQQCAGIVDELNATDAQILNLHWVNEGMLSVSDIGRLEKPIVWTLHDMWAFCGSEHYTEDGPAARFRRGYADSNRPPGEGGKDLDRMTWEAKRRDWAGRKFTIVSPSRWLAECAAGSVLFAAAPVHVIPNALDVEGLWRPIAKETARAALGLPAEKRLVLMGAEGGTSDPRKGGDLLRETIARVAPRSLNDIELVIYGQSGPGKLDRWPCPVHWLGQVRDDRVLVLAYSAADAVVVPSRQDNLPNAAVEAQACGTPVVAFDVGGLPDIVTHQVSGWLAKPFDVDDLAEGLLWVLADEDRRLSLSRAARAHAVASYAPEVVARKYLAVYAQVLGT